MSDDDFTIDGQPVTVGATVNALDLPDEVISPELKRIIREAVDQQVPLGDYVASFGSDGPMVRDGSADG